MGEGGKMEHGEMSQLARLKATCTVICSFLALSACMPVVNHQGKKVGAARVENERYVTADGTVLPLRSWPAQGSARAVIVALHGFNDYSNFFTTPAKYFASQGIVSYAYDQRGFGNAPGRGFWFDIDAYTGDLACFVTEVRKRHPGVPLYVLGESMGGAVTIAAMTRSQAPDVDGVILVAPAVWGRETMPWYQRWLLALGSHTLPWFTLTGKGVKVRASDNKDMLRAFSRDPEVIKATRIDAVYGLSNLMDEALAQAGKIPKPTFVQYGAHDQIIPKEPMLLMLGKMPKTTRKAFYEHGYHMLLRDLQGDKPMADIACWITDHNQPLPYGAPLLLPGKLTPSPPRPSP
jgi:acylglycerol lipase